MLESTTLESSVTQIDWEAAKPHGAYALVKRLPNATRTESGLFLPESQGEKNIFCKVIAPPGGEWVKDLFVKLSIKRGDIVVVRQFDGIKYKVEAGEYIFVHQELIEARIKDACEAA